MAMQEEGLRPLSSCSSCTTTTRKERNHEEPTESTRGRSSSSDRHGGLDRSGPLHAVTAVDAPAGSGAHRRQNLSLCEVLERLALWVPRFDATGEAPIMLLIDSPM